jgi:hypothetical protein
MTRCHRRPLNERPGIVGPQVLHPPPAPPKARSVRVRVEFSNTLLISVRIEMVQLHTAMAARVEK